MKSIFEVAKEDLNYEKTEQRILLKYTAVYLLLSYGITLAILYTEAGRSILYQDLDKFKPVIIFYRVYSLKNIDGVSHISYLTSVTFCVFLGTLSGFSLIKSTKERSIQIDFSKIDISRSKEIIATSVTWSLISLMTLFIIPLFIAGDGASRSDSLFLWPIFPVLALLGIYFLSLCINAIYWLHLISHINGPEN